MPETFDLDNPADCVALIDAETNAGGSLADSNSGESALWIYKPACNNRLEHQSLITNGITALTHIHGSEGGVLKSSLVSRR